MPRGVKERLPLTYARCKFGFMNLDEYLASHDVTASAFAEKIGVSAASVTRIRQGRQNIPLSLAAKIVAASDGKVTLEALAMRSAA